MIKAKFEGKNGEPTFFFGLSMESIARLLTRKPILIDLKEVNDVGRVMIVFGNDEQEILDKMKENGILPADFEPAPNKMHHVIVNKDGVREEKKD